MIDISGFVVHCDYEYQPLGGCSKPCGGGEQVLVPVIIQQPLYGGDECPDYVIDEKTKTKPCNTDPCPPGISQYNEAVLSFIIGYFVLLVVEFSLSLFQFQYEANLNEQIAYKRGVARPKKNGDWK